MSVGMLGIGLIYNAVIRNQNPRNSWNWVIGHSQLQIGSSMAKYLEYIAPLLKTSTILIQTHFTLKQYV